MLSQTLRESSFIHSSVGTEPYMTTAPCKQTGPKPLGGVLTKFVINRTLQLVHHS